MRVVYHGSYIEVPVIDLSKCEAGKDFGRAFYVTKFREQAEYWAERKGRKSNNSGYITEYEYYENAFEQFKLKVLRFDSYNEEWLDFVVANRIPEAVLHGYDIVEGPVANDNIATRIFDYLDGEISKIEFLEELKFKHQESHQIAFCTVASLQMLAWVDRKLDVSLHNINGNVIKSLVKEKKVSEEKAVDLYFTSKTYKQLIDKTIELSTEEPWENVYDLLKNELDINEKL